MIRPTVLPGWASGPSGYVTEPTASQKATGWLANQTPPASYQNWLHKITYDWLAYVDARISIQPVVVDDFATSPQFAGVYNTGFMPFWRASGSSGWALLTSAVGGNTGLHRMGALAIDDGGLGGPSGHFALTSQIGRIGDRDFRMEMIAKCDFVSSGADAEWGVFYESTPAPLHPVGVMSFVATGASAQFLGFKFQPSGQVATSVSLGIAATGMHKFAAERIGATMTIEIDGVVVASLPGRPLGATDTSFGLVGRTRGGGSTIRMITDRVDIGAKRDPI